MCPRIFRTLLSILAGLENAVWTVLTMISICFNPLFISKYKKISCVYFSCTDSSLCIYYLQVWWKFNLLPNSQLITFPTQSCLVLGYYYYCCYYTSCEVPTPAVNVYFHWSLSDNKSLHLSWTLQSIFTDLSCGMVLAVTVLLWRKYLWLNEESVEMQRWYKLVRTSTVLLRSFSDNYFLENYESHYTSNNGLYITTTVPQAWLWH